MTPRKAIQQADEAKPNAFPEEEKFEWLKALEGRIAADVLLATPEELAKVMEISYPDGMDEDLLVKAPHDELYVLYLKAKIDAENGEYSRYADSSQLYNEAYGNFVRYWSRTYEPAQGYERGYTIGTGEPPEGSDPYEGEYEVTPKVYEDTVLATKAKTMRDDVRVLKIPQYEVTNESGGMTLILGDELTES